MPKSTVTSILVDDIYPANLHMRGYSDLIQSLIYKVSEILLGVTVPKAMTSTLLFRNETPIGLIQFMF